MLSSGAALLSGVVGTIRSDEVQEVSQSKLVLVTGAGGQTGSIVVRKLLERGALKFTTRALVRSEESEKKLRNQLGQLGNLAQIDSSLQIVHGDITKRASCFGAFNGVDAVIIVTSAVPRISKASLAGVVALKLVTLGNLTAKPSFWFDEGQSPEQVDWIGQQMQIDTAKAAGVKHIVLVSSMGGTKPDHFLNTNMDNIVLWKRKAERYLIDSGVPYTIIHPGGLLPVADEKKNIPAPGGKRELYVGVDDALMEDEDAKTVGHAMIPREDVAEICVQSLMEPSARGMSFDLGSGPEGEGTIYDGNLQELLSTLGGKSCSYNKLADIYLMKQETISGILPMTCCEAPARDIEVIDDRLVKLEL